MYELKPLHREAIPKALEKAERYRLLNEPGRAVSICDAVLRWNACARLLMENPGLRPAPEDQTEPPFE